MANKIVVIGTGYVGLPAAVMLAHAGCEVIGVDINDNIVDAINNGVMHINEKELQEIMCHDNVKKNLKAQKQPCLADIFIIAVPTPINKRKKIADMSYVESAMESIVPCLQKGNLVIIESTVPPLTCKDMIKPMIEKKGLRVPEDVMVAHCPERILPGNIFYEIVNNDRIIGGMDARSGNAAKEVYSCFVKGNLYVTDDVTAELCKLMENTYRDVNVALANEFSAVGETLGIDIKNAIALANKHPRVNILNPGIGVGGHCIPLDPWFIKEVDPANSSLIFVSRKINEQMPSKTAGKIRRAVKDIESPKIILLGATYKPNTDDLRESPALEVFDLLLEDGYDVKLYDPLTNEYSYSSVEEVVKGADCAAILVEHDVIMKDFCENETQIRKLMHNPVILRF